MDVLDLGGFVPRPLKRSSPSVSLHAASSQKRAKLCDNLQTPKKLSQKLPGKPPASKRLMSKPPASKPDEQKLSQALGTVSLTAPDKQAPDELQTHDKFPTPRKPLRKRLAPEKLSPTLNFLANPKDPACGTWLRCRGDVVECFICKMAMSRSSNYIFRRHERTQKHQQAVSDMFGADASVSGAPPAKDFQAHEYIIARESEASIDTLI